MGLRLGEGSGAILALPLLRSSILLFHGMATLEQVLNCNNMGMMMNCKRHTYFDCSVNVWH